MPRDLRAFVLALTLYTVSGVSALLIALSEGARAGSVIAGAVVAALTMALLWFFAWHGHRWPRWALLFLLIIGIAGLVSFLDSRALLAVLDVLALLLLLRSWPTFSHAT